jgi:hypothetical protein
MSSYGDTQQATTISIEWDPCPWWKNNIGSDILILIPSGKGERKSFLSPINFVCFLCVEKCTYFFMESAFYTQITSPKRLLDKEVNESIHTFYMLQDIWYDLLSKKQGEEITRLPSSHHMCHGKLVSTFAVPNYIYN